MNRLKVAPEYSAEYLEVDRPSPLSDRRIENAIQDIMYGNIDTDISDTVYDNFKKEASEWILGSTLNKLEGLESFDRMDIMNGCTQFIDNIYMQGPVQVLRDDYRYHQRLGYAHFKDVGSLIPDIPLIIAMPFPQVGAPHKDMEEILNECTIKKIPVYIDGAWITCVRDIQFRFDHPAIREVGISLSKGLGLGWNRIGLRWSRQGKADSITIMNDFHMNNRALAMVGLHFVRCFPSDYLWNRYSKIYYQICNDFNLTPTKSIYLALRDGHPVGLSPLIRHVAEK